MIRTALTAALLLVGLPCSVAAWPGTVLSVHDGDTITVAPGGDRTTPMSIRLYGVDAPELDQPGGEEAATWLIRELPSGSPVEIIALDMDRYGRIVGLVQSGEPDQRRTLNAALVQSGQAWVEPQYCKARFCRQWKREERRARHARLGLWCDEQPLRPSDWRRQQRAQK